MSYVVAGDDRHYFMLGAASEPRGLPAYYAAPSDLRWSVSSLRGLHDTLVSMDKQWAALWQLVPFEWVEALPEVPENIADDIRSTIIGPLPIVADLAVILEIVAAGRPLVSSVQGILETFKERAQEVAAAFAVIGSLAGSGALASLALSAAGAASVAGAPVNVASLPSAATFGAIAGMATISAALWGALAAILDGLENGTLSEKDYRDLVRGAAAATGKKVSDDDIATSADFFYGIQSDLLHQRDDAISKAKAKSKAMLDACKARGGHYDQARGACVLAPRGPRPFEQQAKDARAEGTANSKDARAEDDGGGFPWGWVGAGAALLGGVWLWKRRKR